MSSDIDFKRPERIIPHIVYNSDTDFSKITNVLLVDNSVRNYNKFVENCNESTFSITFSQRTDRQEIVDLLASKLPSISRISIVADDSALSGGKKLLNDKPYFLDSDLVQSPSSYSENVQFLIHLIKTHSIKNIDYLACYSLTYDSWNGYYSVLSKETGVIVGASSDRTGNIQYGGDWVMESTGVDVEAIYFTSGISGYQDTLAGFINVSGTISQVGSVITYTPVTGSAKIILDADWPVTFSDGVTLTLTSNLTLNAETKYFNVATANNVTINGDSNTVTIDNVPEPGYVGLVNSKSNNTTVQNIGVLRNNTTVLAVNSGWVGGLEFLGTIDNCYSTGDMSSGNNGGIVGTYAGYLGVCTISNCHSTGAINNFSGGIAGNGAGFNGGNCTITNCYSTGPIISTSGGIVGVNAGDSGVCTITNCYSTGAISSNGSGGIASAGAGANNGVCTISNCYSMGAISLISGGIVGASAGFGGVCIISNCYSTGTISISGGIAADNAGIGGVCTISNCYSTGTISNVSGGIAGRNAGNDGTCTISNCYSTGAISAFSGGITGANAGIEGTCTITNCYSTGGADNDNCGGIVGPAATSTCTISHCYVTGTYPPRTSPENYFEPTTGSSATIDTNTTKYTEDWTNSDAIVSLDNTSGCWKKFVDTNGDSQNIPWNLVSFLTGVTAILSQTINYTNDLFPINAYAGTSPVFRCTNGTVSSNGTLSSDGKTLTFDVISGNLMTIIVNISGIDRYIDTFILGKTDTIPSNTILARNDIYNYMYTYPLKVTGTTVTNKVTIDGNIIVGNFRFLVESGNIVTIGGPSNPRIVTINNVPGYTGLVDSITTSTTVQYIGVLTSGTTTLGAGCGWIGGSNINTFNGTIKNCYSTGAISGVSSGGIVGHFAGNGSGGFCDITNCYSTGVISGTLSGGISGSSVGSNGGNCNINNCYSNGAISGSGNGGITGANTAGGSGSGNCNITNCYSTGAISASCGGIAGVNSTSRCIINRCYVSGAKVTGAFDYSPSSTVTITDCNYNSPWSDAEASKSGNTVGLNNPISDSEWKLIYLDQPWKLKSFLSTANTIYNTSIGILTYTNVFPISAYTNVTRAGLLNGTTTYGSAPLTLTQNNVSLTGTNGIDNGQPTYLVLYNSSGTIVDYADTFTITAQTTMPLTTIPQTTMPLTTMPLTTMPQTTMPQTTMPQTTMPLTSYTDVQFAIDAIYNTVITSEASEKAYITALISQINSSTGSPISDTSVKSVTPGSIVNVVQLPTQYVAVLQKVVQNGDFYITINGVTYYAIPGSFIIIDNICFRRGTMILTPSGYKSVESFKTGDLVKTAQGRNVSVSKVHNFIGKMDKCPLYVLNKESLGPNMPLMDLYMSEGHAYRYKGRWTHMKCSSIAMELDTDDIEYYNIAVENYLQNTLVANGVEVESLFNMKDLEMTWNCNTDNCKPVITMK